MEANEVSILGDRGEINEETGERHLDRARRKPAGDCVRARRGTAN